MADFQSRDDKGRFVSKARLAASESAPVVAAVERLQSTMNKQLALMQRAMSGSRAASKAAQGATGGRGGGVALPSFLSAAVIVGATRALSSYTTSLARARDMAKALGGAFRDITKHLPNQRDSQLFSAFATQNFSNRFAGGTEIEGLKAIRDRLSQALGPEAGAELTLGITQGFERNSEALRDFLAMASADVPRALAEFQNVGSIDAMTTALHASTMQTDELSKTAFTLESAWVSVKDSFERFVKDAVETHGVNLRTIIQDSSKAVVDFINWTNQAAVSVGHAAQFIADAWGVVKDVFRLPADIVDFFTKDLPILLGVNSTEAIDKAIDAALARGDNETAKRLKKSRDEINAAMRGDVTTNRIVDRFTPPPQAERIVLDFAKANEQADKAMKSAADSAKRERTEIEKMLTPAERAAQSLTALGRAAEFLDLGTQVKNARLDFLTESPLGFGQAMQVRREVIESINEQLGNTIAQLKVLGSLERKSDDQKKQELELERQSWELLKSRIGLTKDLQRGYLDAIQASAIGAGHFEKILVSADANLGAALRKGIAKPNPLLGNVGAPWGIQPFRYGTDMAQNDAAMRKYSEALANRFTDLKTLGDRDIIQQLISIRDAMDGRATFSTPTGPQRDAELQRGSSSGGGKKSSKSSSGKDVASILIDAGKMLINAGEQYEAPEELDYSRHRGLRGGAFI